MSTITVKLSEELDAQLAAEAESRRTTKSEVVREALAAALGRSSGKGKRSVYAAMKGSCGVVKEGPRDLSTNKKHFRGYGK